MPVHFRFLGVVTFLSLTVQPVFAQNEAANPLQLNLPKKFASLLDKAAEAEKEGHSEQVLESLQPLFERATPEIIKLADNRLKQTYNLGQTVAELLVAARARLVLDGQGKRLRRPGKKELPLVLVDLADRVAKLQVPLEAELAVGFPALVPDPVIEEKLKEITPLLSTTEQADLLLVYLEDFTERLRRSDLAKLEGKAKEIAARDFAEDRKKLGILRDALVERLVDFTLIRLNKAVLVLQDENAGFQDRFAAVGRAGESLDLLHTHWESYERSRSRSPMGLDPAVKTGWKSKAAQFQQLAGPLLEKVYHYTEGTRWWLRGRYGFGHIGGGLAKAIPGRLPSGSPRVDRALEFLRDYPLQMPNRIEKPDDPLTNPLGFPVPRRHLESWQFDSRLAWVQTFQLGRPAPEPATGTFTSMTPSASRGFFRLQNNADSLLSPVRAVSVDYGNEDLRLGRWVGYLEYLTALAHFDRLLEAATQAEKQALEEMAADDDRYVIYSNLSRKYDALEPASTLRLASRTTHPKASSPWERRGLSWMIALARVEIGAFRAGHTGESSSSMRRQDNVFRRGKRELLADTTGPFSKLPPTDFERDAFFEILWDGARQHYYELRTEFTVLARRGTFSQSAAEQVVTYLLALERKLTLTIEMIEALRLYASERLSPTQQAEVSAWLAWVDQQLGLVRGLLEPPRVGAPQDAAQIQKTLNEALQKTNQEPNQNE